MGDRANIVIVADGYGRENPVYLYTHWRGDEVPTIVAEALAIGESRWSDPSYLARIVFGELTADDPGGLTGYGISGRIGDNEHLVVVLDCKKQAVFFVKEALADPPSALVEHIDSSDDGIPFTLAKEPLLREKYEVSDG